MGVLAGWTRIDVPGATGLSRHRLRGQGQYAIAALADHDIVCVHVEAPDEASHEGRGDAKVEAIERIDRDIVAPVLEALRKHEPWRILISPDHSTLLHTRAHDRAPVAWAMAGTGLPASGLTYDEIAAREGGGPFLSTRYRLMERFLDLSWSGRPGVTTHTIALVQTGDPPTSHASETARAATIGLTAELTPTGASSFGRCDPTRHLRNARLSCRGRLQGR